MTLQAPAAVALVLVAAAVDVRRGRIPDRLTYSAMALGLALATLGGPGIQASVAGWGIAALLFLALYRLHSIGGGDVKLMMAIGAIKGATFTVVASFYILAFGVAAALFVLGWRRRLFTSLRWIGRSVPATVFADGPLLAEPATVMPFAPVICAGVLYCLALEAFRGPFAFAW
jgi:prepilin peptidase CpaA